MKVKNVFKHIVELMLVISTVINNKQ